MRRIVNFCKRGPGNYVKKVPISVIGIRILQEMIDKIRENGNIPVHVAIIMDGNGRWARKRGLPRVEGHREGVNSVRAVVEAAGAIGVNVLTLYTFSTENWLRPKSEVSYLMNLLLLTIRREVRELNKNNVQLHCIGNLDDLPKEARESMLASVEKLKHNTGLKLNLALSYSSRIEIVQAVRNICADAGKGVIQPEAITEKLFASYLYTAQVPDPDLLIRTSGELRLSNFLLWQLAYSELYITTTLWPDFRQKEFFEAIFDYQKRERRFGRVSEQVNAAKGCELKDVN